MRKILQKVQILKKLSERVDLLKERTIINDDRIIFLCPVTKIQMYFFQPIRSISKHILILVQDLYIRRATHQMQVKASSFKTQEFAAVQSSDLSLQKKSGPWHGQSAHLTRILPNME